MRRTRSGRLPTDTLPMQAFLSRKKAPSSARFSRGRLRRFPALLFAIAAPVVALQGQELAREWSGGYNSEDAGLEDPLETGRDEQLYTLEQLETLRRAVGPRYVRVLNYRHYAGAGEYIQKGVLFTYAGYRAERVRIAGDFNNWSPAPMHRNKMGVYYVVLPVREIEAGERILSYKYKFLVDGIWTHDPENKTRRDDGLGGYLSVFQLERPDVNRQIAVRVLKEGRRGGSEERLVEFAIYMPDAENLSLVGDFNNWNPEHDLLTRGDDGIFRLRLRLRPGSYHYKYVADGRWILDQYNEETRYHTGIRTLVSFLRIE